MDLKKYLRVRRFADFAFLLLSLALGAFFTYLAVKESMKELPWAIAFYLLGLGILALLLMHCREEKKNIHIPEARQRDNQVGFALVFLLVALFLVLLYVLFSAHFDSVFSSPLLYLLLSGLVSLFGYMVSLIFSDSLPSGDGKYLLNNSLSFLFTAVVFFVSLLSDIKENPIASDGVLGWGFFGLLTVILSILLALSFFVKYLAAKKK